MWQCRPWSASECQCARDGGKLKWNGLERYEFVSQIFESLVNSLCERRMTKLKVLAV